MTDKAYSIYSTAEGTAVRFDTEARVVSGLGID